jgi:MFS family permease
MNILRKFLDGFRPAWTTVLLVYFCYGASAITGVAEVFFQKETLKLSPVEVAGIGFWLGLPWSMKMVVGVASDIHPLFGSRRASYLLLGTVASLAGFLALATTVDTKSTYLLASLLITIGFMIQDVIADALSVEVAETEEEIGQIQTLGRMVLLLGGISVGYISGVLAGAIGPRGVYALASVLPLLVAASIPFSRMRRKREASAGATIPKPPHAISHEVKNDPLGGGKARLVILVGLGYAALGVVLEMFKMPFSQEIVLVVSLVLIGLLLRRVDISRGVAIAAMVIFLFRATPGVGQGYSYWAIDKLGFDQEFLGVLAQVSSILSLAGLLVFRKYIVEQPVSFTLFWVVVVGTILSFPNIGLFYGLHEWLGITARTLAFIDTTITAPLAQLTMVPMLILIARTAPPGAEATMFAIMASLMNLALSTSQLFTQYLNDFFQITQEDFSNLGILMITVTGIGLLPLLALPLLRRVERVAPAE